MVETLKAVKFLFTAPLILLFLFVINLMTSPGHWWVQWAALGLGIAWFFSLLRVIRAVIVAGGLAALGDVFVHGVDISPGRPVALARVSANAGGAAPNSSPAPAWPSRTAGPHRDQTARDGSSSVPPLR